MFFTSILLKALQQLVGCSCTGGKDDRFSELPDDLLLNILERVGTLDAVRACVLSKKLLKLPAMLSRIVIDVGDVPPWRNDPTDHDMVQANRAVAELTDKILAARPPQVTIRDLKLTFILRNDHCLSIGRSVAQAMTKSKLDKVQFNILTEELDNPRLGKQFNAFFVASQDAFAGLTVLKLENLRFSESDLANILGTCKRLEYLRLEYCDAGIGAVMKIEHDRLAELKIVSGEYETLELCRLPKLQRVTCAYLYHDRKPLVFGFVPQLSKLSLTKCVFASDMTLRLSQLLANVSSIGDLRLDFQSEKVLKSSTSILYDGRIIYVAISCLSEFLGCLRI
jgi:hypothetical protein